MSTSRYLILHLISKDLITAYNIKTRQTEDYDEDDFQNFATSAQLFAKFKSISSNNLKRIKAIAFSFHGDEFPTAKKQYEFLCECRQFCQQNGIFCFFPSYFHNQSTAILLCTRDTVKEGEKLMTISLDHHYPTRSTALGNTLIRKNDCYEITKTHGSKYPLFTQQWQDDMFGLLKPAKIIILHQSGSKDAIKAQHFFHSYHPVLLCNDELAMSITDGVMNKILFLMDEQVIQYNVANQTWCTFEVRLDGKSLIKATKSDALPCEKSIIIDVNPAQSVSLFCKYSINSPEIFEEIKLSAFKCKKVTVTLKLDYNSFYEFKVEPIEDEMEGNMSEDDWADKLVDIKHPGETDAATTDTPNSPVDKKLSEKARMTFDKQSFCVSYFADGKEYGVNDSDGLNKTPIYISFTEKKPIIGKVAMELYSEKPQSIVFDVESPKWGFTLSKEEESIMVTWETPEEKQKQTVEFLLALILKNGKDRIKKKYGKRMKDIEIGFDGFVPNEMLKKNFVEAGKLLKINIVFV